MHACRDAACAQRRALHVWFKLYFKRLVVLTEHMFGWVLRSHNLSRIYLGSHLLCFPFSPSLFSLSRILMRSPTFLNFLYFEREESTKSDATSFTWISPCCWISFLTHSESVRNFLVGRFRPRSSVELNHFMFVEGSQWCFNQTRLQRTMQIRAWEKSVKNSQNQRFFLARSKKCTFSSEWGGGNSVEWPLVD